MSSMRPMPRRKKANLKMTPHEFAKKVAYMRDAQKLCFDQKQPNVLREAKKLEREVDRAIKGIMDAQKQLF